MPILEKKITTFCNTAQPFLQKLGPLATPGTTQRYGYISEEIAGHCFPHPVHVAVTVPLYLYYWNRSISSHFYATNAAEIGTTALGQVGNYGYWYKCV